MEQRNRHHFFLVGFGVGLYAVLMHLGEVGTLLDKVSSVLSPLLMGAVFAFILNVPMRSIEQILSAWTARRGRSKSPALLRIPSLILTLLLILMVLLLVVTMVIPNLAQSLGSLFQLWQEKLPELTVNLQGLGVQLPESLSLPTAQDLQGLLSDFTGKMPSVVQSVAGAAASTVGAVATAGIAFVVALYILIYKEELSSQSKDLLCAYTSEQFAARACSIAELIDRKFSSFLSGQCIEAVILGLLMFFAFTLFRLPYAGLVGALTAVTSFIPYVGSYLSCFIGALLIFLVSPVQCVVSIVVYQVTQFIENQFIYPRVVGGSVGLSPFWTFVAVMLGGNLFGVLGMVFFIPIASVIFELVRESVQGRLNRKSQP